MKLTVKKMLIFMLMVLGMLGLTACGREVPENRVYSVDDLGGKKIGVQLGTTGDIYVSDLEDEAPGTVIERYNKGADAVASLKQGKIDCVVIDEQPAKAYLDVNPELRILDEEFTLEEYAAVIAKGNEELLSKVNDALEELRKDGTLQKIIDAYISKDEVKETKKEETEDAEEAGETEDTEEKGDQKEQDESLPFSYEQKVTTGEKLVMATNAQFPPYEFYQGGEISGIDVDIAKAIADKLGRVLVIEDMEFDSIINAVSSGKADIGLAGFTVTDERKKQINFSEPYTTSKQVVIVRDDEAIREADSLKTKLYNNFIKDDRWIYLVEGLLNTILITIVAILIGITMGFLLALVRVAHDRNGSFKILNFFAKLYVTIIRGTPMMVQLLIIYFVIFESVNVSKILVAIIAFGLNSAAYLCEVIRSGIMSIDRGQFEAGQSLGLSYSVMMKSIILPQALKNVLPAIGNEFIALLKETSIAGYIGLQDLTKGGDIIRSITYEPLLPLLAVALVYLILVSLLSALVSKLERRLKKNER